MTVYIVIHVVYYEFSEVDGVFSSESKARESIKYREDSKYEGWEIIEWVVDGEFVKKS